MKPEEVATYMCNIIAKYARHRGLTNIALEEASGVNRYTIGCLGKPKPPTFPNLLTFLKLTAALGLEVSLTPIRHPTAPTQRQPAHDTDTDTDNEKKVQ